MESAAVDWILPVRVCATISTVVPALGGMPHVPSGSKKAGDVKVPAEVAVVCARLSKALTTPSIWTKCLSPIEMGTPPGQPVPRTTIWVSATALAVLSEIWAPVAYRGTEAEAMRPVAMDAPQERGRVAAARAGAGAVTSSIQKVARVARAQDIDTAMLVRCHPYARACSAARVFMLVPSHSHQTSAVEALTSIAGRAMNHYLAVAVSGLR